MMYCLYSIKKNTSRQAPFGIWTEQNESIFSAWPITIQESHLEYFLSRQAGEAEDLLMTLPDDATGVQLFDALAKAEGLLPWIEHRAVIRERYFSDVDENSDEDDREELADFDAGTQCEMPIP